MCVVCFVWVLVKPGRSEVLPLPFSFGRSIDHSARATATAQPGLLRWGTCESKEGKDIRLSLKAEGQGLWPDSQRRRAVWKCGKGLACPQRGRQRHVQASDIFEEPWPGGQQALRLLRPTTGLGLASVGPRPTRSWLWGAKRWTSGPPSARGGNGLWSHKRVPVAFALGRLLPSRKPPHAEGSSVVVVKTTTLSEMIEKSRYTPIIDKDKGTVKTKSKHWHSTARAGRSIFRLLDCRSV